MRLLFFILWSSAMVAQPLNFITKPHDRMYADIFQNLYIQRAQTLVKCDTTGKELKQYANFMLGNITSVDVSNPLKILVFYAETNYLLTLTNDLISQSNPISLDEAGFVAVKAGCSAEKYGFWIYDGQKKQLLLLDHKLRPLYFGTIVSIENITNMLADNNTVYIGSVNKGIYEFDQTGKFRQFHPFEQLKYFMVYQSKLFVANGNQILCEQKEVLSLNKPVEHFAIIKQGIYISAGDSIFIYRW